MIIYKNSKRENWLGLVLKREEYPLQKDIHTNLEIYNSALTRILLFVAQGPQALKFLGDSRFG